MQMNPNYKPHVSLFKGYVFKVSEDYIKKLSVETQMGIDHGERGNDLTPEETDGNYERECG